MLTKADIKRLAGYSYTKGLDIYYQDKVLSFSTDEKAEEDIITARVKGSGRRVYDVRMTVDLVTDRVKESYCECPAFYSYPTLCKHCTAVLLEYSSFRQRRQNTEYHMRRRGEAADPQPADRNKRKTTRSMKELLKRQTVRQTLPFLKSDMYGKVRIEPILSCAARECQVEFRIGISKMYVLKDVFTFAQAMQDGQEYSYGKNLEFVHTAEMFDSRSAALAGFISGWTRRNKGRFVQGGYHSYPYGLTLPKLRNLPLDGGDLEELLDALGDMPFTANVGGGGERDWRTIPDGLRRHVSVIGTGDGMEVGIDPLFGYECSRNFVYFRDGFIYRVPKKELEPVRDFIACIRDLPDRKAFVSREDIPAFFRQVMPALRQCYDCTVENLAEDDYGIVPAVFQFYLDMPQKDFVTCKAVAIYGQAEYNVYDSAYDMEKRDIYRESEIGKTAAAYCNAYDELEQVMVITGDEERLFAMLTEGIGRLQELGEVFISDALKRIRVLSPPKVSVGISLSGDLLTLKMTAEDMPREQLIEILSRYDRRKKFFRLRDGTFIHMEEDGLGPLEEIRKGLQLTDRQLQQESVEVPRYRTLYLDEELRGNLHISVQKDKNFRALIRNMRTVEDNDFEVPDSLKDILREYQRYGYRWIRTLMHNGFGGILADDMGLGKTLQVICFLLSVMGEREDREAAGGAVMRCLIVCPASLVYNWKREFERFAPGLPARMMIGSAAEREAVLKELSDREILITSYELLRRDIEQYEGISFFCQIIDEAQYIKNHGTQAAKAVKAVTAGFKLALTGTPVENRLSELWSIFDYLMPGYLYSYQRFREELEQPAVQKNDEAAAERLQKMIRPFVLRRLKRDVLRELPDKLEENLFAKMEGEQQELYDAHVKRMQLMLDSKSEEEFRSNKLQILAELTKLRQICCDPALLLENYKGESAKREMVVNLIHNAVENGHKVLLFSQFTTMLERISHSLEEEGISFHMLTGATPKAKRAEMVEAFQFDDVPVFCISLKAGGTGLNLTAADVVIHFDPWWNVAVQNQATDRAHRIGQKNVVNVYRLIAKGTIEEKIVELQERKRELADRILGGDMGGGSLTREELLELLQR